jgi:hypothetical protein
MARRNPTAPATVPPTQRGSTTTPTATSGAARAGNRRVHAVLAYLRR